MFSSEDRNPKRFSAIANRIFNEYALMIGRKRYRIYEIEFYLNSKEHPDLYTHGLAEQFKKNKFYFHRTIKGGYKGGTFKGVDLTYGNKTTAFGILIRGITRKDEWISGPCLVVDKILEITEAGTIQGLTEGDSMGIYDSELLYMKKYSWKAEELYRGPRIGLNPEKHPEWANKKYRFAIFPQKVKHKKTTLKLLQ